MERVGDMDTESELKIAKPQLLIGVLFPLVQCNNQSSHPGILIDMWRVWYQKAYICVWCGHTITFELLRDRYPSFRWE